MTIKQMLVPVAFLALASSIFSVAHAQTYDISWYTIDGGGGYSTTGNFELEGTIGQPDAGPTMTGGNFALTGGFWAGGSVQIQTQTVADSIDIFRGQLIGGTLEDTFDSDDSRMLFNPGLVLNSTEAPVWLIFDGALPTQSPATLSILMEAQAGTPGLTGTLEAWNWPNGAYDQIDVSSTSFNSDSVVTVDLSNSIEKHVESATGKVRTRIGWRKTGLTINFPWQVRLDQMVWLSN